MKLTIDIPDNQISRVVQAFVSTQGYQDTVQDTSVTDSIVYIPNPQTRGEFTRQCVINYIRRITKEYELDQARRSISLTDVDAV